MYYYYPDGRPNFAPMFALFLAGAQTMIDLGSAFYKSAATVGSDLPLVSLNPQSKRSTPAFVAFRARPGFNATSKDALIEDDCEFLTADLGDKAIGASILRPKMVGGYFSVLIGRNDSVVKMRSEKLRVPVNPARVQLNDAAAISLGL
jgi:hypothetical protein